MHIIIILYFLVFLLNLCFIFQMHPFIVWIAIDFFNDKNIFLKIFEKNVQQCSYITPNR